MKVERDEITGKLEIVTVRNDGIRLVNLSELDHSITAAIREVRQSRNGSPDIKFYSKLHALYLLGKHYGLFANENSKPDGRNDQDIAGALAAAIKRVEEKDARDRRSH